MKRYFPPSELLIEPNGAVYHLGVKPSQLAGKVILQFRRRSACPVTAAAVAVNGESRVKKAEFLANRANVAISKIHFKLRKPSHYAFLDVSNLIAARIVYAQQMSPRKLSLHGVGNVALFVGNGDQHRQRVNVADELFVRCFFEYVTSPPY